MKLRNSEVREREMERKVQLAWNPFAVEKTHYFHRDFLDQYQIWLLTSSIWFLLQRRQWYKYFTHCPKKKIIHLSRHTAVEWKLFRFQRFDTREVWMFFFSSSFLRFSLFFSVFTTFTNGINKLSCCFCTFYSTFTKFYQVYVTL